MKKLEFETSKGNFLLVDMDFESVLDKYKGLKFTFMYPLKHISELEASEIVFRIGHHSNGHLIPSAVELLHSLLKSKGIHLFENPVKLPHSLEYCSSRWSYYGYEVSEYRKAEQKTFYNPYIFKL